MAVSIFGIIEGIIVLIAIILIIIGFSLLAADQNWLSGSVVLIIGSILMAARIMFKKWQT
jgi:membrane-bound ClpP family serine protease